MNSPGYLVFLLSLGHFCADFIQGALPALLPFLKDRFDLSYAVAGMLLMATHVTSSVVQPFFGYFTDRKPFPHLLPLGLLVSGAGLALVPFSPSIPWLVAFVMFMGLGTAAYHPEGFKATACIVSEKRATGMSLFSLGGSIGMALGGPATIWLVSRYGLHGSTAVVLPAVAATVLLLQALQAIRRRVDDTETVERSHVANRPDRPWYTVTLLLLIVVLRSWSHLGLTTYIPFIYRSRLDTDPGYVATLLLVFLGAGAVGTLIGGPLADRIGHRRFLFASTGLTIPLIHLFLHSTGWAVFALAALMGATIVSSFSVTMVIAQELFPRRLATASGAVAGFAIGTGGIGVTLLGTVADRHGIPAAMLLVNAFPAFGLLLVLFLPIPWKSHRLT